MFRIFPILVTALIFCSLQTPPDPEAVSLTGAWGSESGSQRMTRIFTEKYFSLAAHNPSGNEFIGTAGGSWRIEGTDLVEMFEFNTWDPELVGKEIRTPVEIRGSKMTIADGNEKQAWTRIDDGTPGELAGAWLITGRYRDGAIQRRTPGVRKTMKILSGKHFQWIAYNTETREFSGTGGGTYTTTNGKYTENIQFFSRDKSRVGASLQFDFSLEDGEWRHKGLSSRGEPIDEVWTRRERMEGE
jgi:hypothetical protein